jgi:hypothetical protein
MYLKFFTVLAIVIIVIVEIHTCSRRRGGGGRGVRSGPRNRDKAPFLVPGNGPGNRNEKSTSPK